MNYACICLYIMACRVYNKFSVWVSTRGNSLSLLLFSLHVAIFCCYKSMLLCLPHACPCNSATDKRTRMRPVSVVSQSYVIQKCYHNSIFVYAAISPFSNVGSNLTKQKQQEDSSSDNDVKIDEVQPLRICMFINGVGGTGKLFLIETIKCFVDSLWKAKPGELSCAIVAPTGLAAFNVGGLTIHRLFQLPIEHDGKTAGYWSLPKDTQKKLQTTLDHLK